MCKLSIEYDKYPEIDFPVKFVYSSTYKKIEKEDLKSYPSKLVV
jgi:hypothetical protein